MTVALIGDLEETGAIIGAAIAVQTALGTGLAERIYRRALVVELRLRGVACSAEVPFKVSYRGHEVGRQAVDLVAAFHGPHDTIERYVVELKHFSAGDVARWNLARTQCGTYLAVAGVRLGLVLNFGEVPLGVRRVLNPRLAPVPS